MGALIGKGGESINEIRRNSQSDIQVDEMAPGIARVSIRGNCDLAQKLIFEKLKEKLPHLFPTFPLPTPTTLGVLPIIPAGQTSPTLALPTTTAAALALPSLNSGTTPQLGLPASIPGLGLPGTVPALGLTRSTPPLGMPGTALQPGMAGMPGTVPQAGLAGSAVPPGMAAAPSQPGLVGAAPQPGSTEPAPEFGLPETGAGGALGSPPAAAPGGPMRPGPMVPGLLQRPLGPGTALGGLPPGLPGSLRPYVPAVPFSKQTPTSAQGFPATSLPVREGAPGASTTPAAPKGILSLNGLLTRPLNAQAQGMGTTDSL